MPPQAAREAIPFLSHSGNTVPAGRMLHFPLTSASLCRNAPAQWSQMPPAHNQPYKGCSHARPLTRLPSEAPPGRQQKVLPHSAASAPDETAYFPLQHLFLRLYSPLYTKSFLLSRSFRKQFQKDPDSVMNLHIPEPPSSSKVNAFSSTCNGKNFHCISGLK